MSVNLVETKTDTSRLESIESWIQMAVSFSSEELENIFKDRRLQHLKLKKTRMKSDSSHDKIKKEKKIRLSPYEKEQKQRANREARIHKGVMAEHYRNIREQDRGDA